MKSVSLLGLSLGILFILLTLQPQLELKRSQTREFLKGFKSAVVTSSMSSFKTKSPGGG